MLGFGKKADQRTVYEKIVDDGVALFMDQWSDGQKRAFVETLMRIFPTIARESAGLNAIPVEQIIAFGKRSLGELWPKLAIKRMDALKELGRVFVARGERMRDYCARVAKELQLLEKLQAVPTTNDNGAAS